MFLAVDEMVDDFPGFLDHIPPREERMVSEEEIAEDAFVGFRSLFGFDELRPDSSGFLGLSVFFYIETDGYPFVRSYLEYDAIPIDIVLLVVQNRGIFPEFYDYFGFLFRESFPGSEIDRHTLETPVVHFESESGKCFCVGGCGHSGFLFVSLVLTENHMRRKIGSESERADDFHFLVVNGRACQSMRRFHHCK